MSLTIHKYALDMQELELPMTLLMPKGAQILSVGYQRDSGAEVKVWALVDDEKPSEVRYFAVFGTGWDCDYLNSAQYEWQRFLGTVQFPSGLVVHVFEVWK